MESPQIYSAKGSESSLSEQGGDSFVPQMPSALSELPHAPALSYLQKLQKIETNAKAEIAAFDSMYQSQLRGSAAGSKRKAIEIDPDKNEDEDENNSDGDSGSDSENEDEVPHYDPDSQKRPRLPMYHPGFELSEKIAQQTLSVFGEFLHDSGDKSTDAEFQYLSDRIKELQDIGYENVVGIAVTGDTGSGKSATVNSIIGEDGLTPEGDSGSACTNVITEFSQASETQQVPISVLVELYCLEKCHVLVIGWFKDWFNVSQMLEHEDDAVDDNDTARKDASFECLQNLFAHQKNPADLHEYLSSAKSEEDTTILKQLKEWTTNIRSQFIETGQNSLELTSNAHPDMREQLRPFRGRAQDATFKGKRLCFSPWPLVSIIRYRLHKAILNEGNCIADIPGAGDVNYHRVQIANEYLQFSRVIIVVGEIKRLTSDSAFRHHYLDAHRRKHNGSVILVATKSDDINDDSTTTIELEPEEEDDWECINSDLETVEAQIKKIDNEIKELGKRSTAKKELREKKKPLISCKNVLEKECRKIRIVSRNRHVTQTMENKYRSDTGDEKSAPSFCISNRMYMRHVRGYNRRSPDKVPNMSIEETQVPLLRAHIFAIPSEGRAKVLNHYIAIRMTTLLTLLRLSCSMSTKARVDELIRNVNKCKRRMDEDIREVIDNFVNNHLRRLIGDLSDQALQLKFDEGAAEKLVGWKKLAPATHQAVVRKRGVYSQKKKKVDFNWNEDLLKSVSNDISKPFLSIHGEITGHFKAELAQCLKGSIHGLNRSLKEDPKALAGDVYNRCFSNNLKNYEKAITNQLEEVIKALRNAFSNIHQKCIRTREDDYITQSMMAKYDEALAQKPTKGQTLRDARHAYLADALLGPDSVFGAFNEWAKQDADEKINELYNDVGAEMGDIFANICAAFEQAKNRPENDTEEGKKFREELRKLVAKAEGILEGVAHESLGMCLAWK